MELDPLKLGAQDRYRLMIGLIVPRPIAFVSTIGVDGSHNLAPFSYFNGAGTEPFTVLFCPSNKPDGSEKDTLRNCKPVSEGGMGQFVVNAAVESYARELSASSESLAYGESEFAMTGLETAPSLRVCPPRVAKSPWAMECETLQVVRLAANAPTGANIVIGRVVHLFVDDAIVDARLHTDYARLGAIGRLGGITYCDTRGRFDIPRGRAALEVRPEQ